MVKCDKCMHLVNPCFDCRQAVKELRREIRKDAEAEERREAFERGLIPVTPLLNEWGSH